MTALAQQHWELVVKQVKNDPVHRNFGRCVFFSGTSLPDPGKALPRTTQVDNLTYMSSGGCTVYQNYIDAGVLTCKVEQGPDRMSKLITVDFTPEVLLYVMEDKSGFCIDVPVFEKLVER